MVTRTGIDFLIDATDRQLIVFPHLVSLPKGFANVQKELNRLNGLKFNDSVALFLSCRISRCHKAPQAASTRTEIAAPPRAGLRETKQSTPTATSFPL